MKKFKDFLKNRIKIEHIGSSFVADENPIIDSKDRGAIPYYSNNEKPPIKIKKQKKN